jgi:hypothetical protein
MIALDGKNYPTIEDAIKQFRVSAKTVYEWIENGIIDEPPTADQGLRTVKIFPKSYMRKAKKDVERYKEGLKKAKSKTGLRTTSKKVRKKNAKRLVGTTSASRNGQTSS